MFTGVSQKNKGVAKTYFDEHLSHNDYYTQGEIEVGRWIGLGAEHLGLVEGQPIDRQAFMDLCDNLNPKDGGLLTQRLNKDDNRRVFYDFTCSAPKSVSIMAITMDDERVIRAHQAASRFAAKELERYAGTRIRKDGKEEDRPTGNVVGAEFLHNSSRALDPQLHTHFTLFNATHDPKEQCWKALQTSDMFATIRYASEVYRNDLARRLHEIGYETVRTDKAFEIKGVSKDLVKKFSKRSAERDREIAKMEKKLGIKLDNNGISNAVHQTRSRKLKGISTAEVRRRQLAELDGNEIASLKAVKTAANGFRKDFSNEVTHELAMELATSHVFERSSVVRQEELLREALVQGRGQVDLGQLKEAVQKGEAFVKVGSEISTREILETELFLIEKMNAGKDGVTPLAQDFKPSSKLGLDQHKAVELILKSSDQFTGIRGLAGTGKSTALSELDRGLTQGGFRGVYVTPTGSAAEVLRKDGFDAVTLQRLLVDEKLRDGVTAQSVIVLDEAGAVGIDDMKKVFSLAVEKDARIVFSGDTGQHASVARGDALRILEEHSRYSFGELTEIRRQQRSDYLDVVKLAADKKAQLSFDRLDAMGDVFEPDSSGFGFNFLYETAADAYLDAREKGRTALLVSPTWSEIDSVTECVRKKLKDQKVIHGKDSSFEVLDSLKWTNAQKCNVHQYDSGQVLLFHQNTGTFVQNETARVIGHDRKSGSLKIKREDGKEDLFRPVKGVSFDVCEAHEIKIAAGDQILLQANRREQKLINGQLVEVKAVKDGRIELADGRELPRNYRKFCHGYAVTSHASQGKTVDEVLIVASSRSLPAVDQKQFYVSVSRGRERCRVFTDDKELLRDRVARVGTRKAAVELTDLREALERKGLIPVTAKREKVRPHQRKIKVQSIRPMRLTRDIGMTRSVQVNRLARLSKTFHSWTQKIERAAVAVKLARDAAAIKIKEVFRTRQHIRERSQEQSRGRDFGPSL